MPRETSNYAGPKRTKITKYEVDHSQLMHMRISYHFLAGLADLHIPRYSRETLELKKRIRNI